MEWYEYFGIAWVILGGFTTVWFAALLAAWKRAGGMSYKPGALLGILFFGMLLWPVTLFLLVTSLLERPRQ